MNITGEAMYNESQEREARSIADYNAMMARRQQPQSASSGSSVPKIDLQDTEEQIKQKIAMREKELAVFKAGQDSMIDISKRVSEITLADLKQRYDSGAISTREYYEQEKSIALAAADAKLQAASDYLKKEQEMLQFILEKRKGTDNPEYQSELAKNAAADKAVSDAALERKKVEITEEGKFQEALRKRSDEYAKLISKAQEEAGEFVKSAETKQAAERKSIEFLRLEKDAISGIQGAVEALAVKEREFETEKVQAQIKESEDRRKYADEIQRITDELAILNGANREQIQQETELRTIRNEMVSLQERLLLATAKADQVAISGLTQQITLQEQLNQKKQEQLAQQQQAAVWNGTIVGFNGNTPIYADNWQQNQYQYQSPYTTALNATTNAISGFTNPNAFPSSISSPFLGGFETGTNYVPSDGYAFLHQGEAVVPKKYNAPGSVSAPTSISSADNSLTPAYADDWKSRLSQNQFPGQAAQPIKAADDFSRLNSFGEQLDRPENALNSSGLDRISTGNINEGGPEYLPMGNKGGYITPAGQTPVRADQPTTTSISIGDIRIELPNITKVSDREADELARAVFLKIKQYSSRYAA